MEVLQLIKNKHFRAALEASTTKKREKLIFKALEEVDPGGFNNKVPKWIKVYCNVFTQPYSSVDFYISTPHASREAAIKSLDSPKVPRRRYVDTIPVMVSFKKYLQQQIRNTKNPD